MVTSAEIMNADDYRLVKQIKVGGQATVELRRHSKTGELVATKTEEQIHIDDREKQILEASHSLSSRAIAVIEDPLGFEAKILAELHQFNVPGVVPFKGIAYSNNASNNIDTDTDTNNNKNIVTNDNSTNPSKKSLILGYCNRGDLHDLLKAQPNRRLSEDEGSRILNSLVRTLKCCHALGIMHRDIKLQNVFLISNTYLNNFSGNSSNTNGDLVGENTRLSSWSRSKIVEATRLVHSEANKCNQEMQEEKQYKYYFFPVTPKYDYQVVLGDFGLAEYFDNPCQLGLTSHTGSIQYMAPEVIQGTYDERADVWSLGIVLHALLLGSPPFQGYTHKDIINKILTKHLVISSATPFYRALSPSAHDLLGRMLDKNPCTRITLDEIQNHPWLANNNVAPSVVHTQRPYKQCCFSQSFLNWV